MNNLSRLTSSLHAFSSVFKKASASIARFVETQPSSRCTNSLIFLDQSTKPTFQSIEPPTQYQDTHIPDQQVLKPQFNFILEVTGVFCQLTAVIITACSFSVPFTFLSSQLQYHYDIWDTGSMWLNGAYMGFDCSVSQLTSTNPERVTSSRVSTAYFLWDNPL